MKKIIKTLFFTSLLACIGVRSVKSQNSHPDKVMNKVLNEIYVNKNYKSPSLVQGLENIILNSKSTDTVLEAKVILSLCLIDDIVSIQEKKLLLDRHRNLCSQVIAEAPDSWQAAVAQMLLVAERDFQGDHKTEIVMAKKALSTIDFDRLEKTDNPAWSVIKKTLDDVGDEPYVLRETLKIALVNALCAEHRLHEAEEVMKEFTSEKCASLIRDRVELERKYHEKRKQRQSNQLQGKQQQTYEPVKTVAPTRNPVIQNPASKIGKILASTNSLPVEETQLVTTETPSGIWKILLPVFGIGILVIAAIFEFKKK